MKELENNNELKPIYPILFDRDFAVSVPAQMSISNYTVAKYLLHAYDVEMQYHYTDINGFMGIMQNKELWATNTKFLNDKTECIEGLILGQEMLKECSDACTNQYKDYFKCFHNMIQDRIEKGSEQNIYSISFCKDGDLLSQWRGYGKKGGVSIGFDLTKFKIELNGKEGMAHFNFLDRYYYETVPDEKRKNDDFLPDDGEFGIKLLKVIYDKKEQEKILTDLIGLGMEAIEKHESGLNIEGLVRNIIYSMEYLLPIFKNKGFEEEKEVRYVWRDDGSRKIYFRERNGIIIPYIRCMIRDCNCRELKVFPVKDIIVGPQVNQQEVIDSIKYFLHCNGYEYLVDKVRPSKIPYRE